MRLSANMWHKAANYLVPMQQRNCALIARMKWVHGEQELKFLHHLEQIRGLIQDANMIAHYASCELNGSGIGVARACEGDPADWPGDGI